MAVQVLYFSRAAQLAGMAREELELAQPCSLAELRAAILARHPKLAEHSASLLWAIDERMAAPEDRVEPGQTLAVMPPFSGG